MVRFSLKVRRAGSPNASAARRGAEVASRGGPDAGSSSMGFQSLKFFFAQVQFDTPVYSIRNKKLIEQVRIWLLYVPSSFPVYPYTSLSLWEIFRKRFNAFLYVYPTTVLHGDWAYGCQALGAKKCPIFAGKMPQM